MEPKISAIYRGASPLASSRGLLDRLPIGKAARERRSAAKTKKEEARTALEQTFTAGDNYDRGLFVARENTGAATNDRHERTAGLEPGTVHISENLKSQYTRFLTDFIHSLNNAKVMDPATQRRCPDFTGSALESPEHEHERALYMMVTNANGEIDTKKVEELLKTSHGIVVVEEIMEDHLAKKLFGMGLHAFADPQGDRGPHNGTGPVRLHVDQGLVNKIFEDYILPWLGSDIGAAGRPNNPGKLLRERWEKLVGALGIASAMGTIAQYGLTALGIGAGLGPAAAGAAVGVGVAAFLNSTRRGFHIDRDFCGAAFERANGDPAEKAYLEQVFGIYTDDFTHNGNDFTYARTPQTAGRDALMSDAMKMMYTRFQYHAEIRVDVKDVDALLEQAILQGNVGGGALDGMAQPFEQGRTLAKERIKVIYLQLYPQGLDPYLGVGNPHGNDEQEMTFRLGKLSEARRRFINESYNSMLDADQLKKLATREAAFSAGLGTKKADYLVPAPGSGDAGGRIYSTAVERLTRQETRLRQDQTFISSELTLVRAYVDHNRPVQEINTRINTQLDNLNLAEATIAGSGLGLVTGTQHDNEESALIIINRILSTNTVDTYLPGINIDGQGRGPNSIETNRRLLNQDARTQVAHERTVDLGAGVSLNQAEINLRTAESDYNTRHANVMAIESQRADAEARMKSAITALGNVKGPQGANVTAQVTSLQNAVDALRVRLDGTGPNDLPTLLANARTQERTALDAKNLSETTKQDAEARFATERDRIQGHRDAELAALDAYAVRLRTELANLQQAITDRNAAETLAQQNAQTPDIQAAERLIRPVTGEYDVQSILFGTFGITNAQLMTLSVDQIMDLVNAQAAIAPPIAGSWPPNENQNESRRQQVLHAQIAARILTLSMGAPITNVHRTTALEEYIQALNAQITIVEGNKNNYINTAAGQEIVVHAREIELAVDLDTRRSALATDNSLLLSFQRFATREPEFVLPIPATDLSLTAHERDNGVVGPGNDPVVAGVDFGATVPRAYFDILQLLTDYQNQSDRGAAFRRIARVLPPDTLAQLMINHMPAGFRVGIGVINMDNVANQFRNPAVVQYTQPEILRACIRGIINERAQAALALP